MHQLINQASRIVEDLSVQLIKYYKGQLYINMQDKATSVIVIVPK